MKKRLLSLLALSLMGVGSTFAQSEIHTYSVYDVNHDAAVTVDDVTTVVNHALKANAESPQTVDAAALNAFLQSIDNRLARIEEKLGIVDEGADEGDPHEYVDLGLPSGSQGRPSTTCVPYTVDGDNRNATNTPKTLARFPKRC